MKRIGFFLFFCILSLYGLAQAENDKDTLIIRQDKINDWPRACLKKAFRELRVPVCGRFYPNEGGVAGYGNRMRVKYTAKWGLQIAEMIFQTRSSIS